MNRWRTAAWHSSDQLSHQLLPSWLLLHPHSLFYLIKWAFIIIIEIRCNKLFCYHGYQNQMPIIRFKICLETNRLRWCEESNCYLLWGWARGGYGEVGGEVFMDLSIKGSIRDRRPKMVNERREFVRTTLVAGRTSIEQT